MSKRKRDISPVSENTIFENLAASGDRSTVIHYEMDRDGDDLSDHFVENISDSDICDSEEDLFGDDTDNDPNYELPDQSDSDDEVILPTNKGKTKPKLFSTKPTTNIINDNQNNIGRPNVNASQQHRPTVNIPVNMTHDNVSDVIEHVIANSDNLLFKKM